MEIYLRTKHTIKKGLNTLKDRGLLRATHRLSVRRKGMFFPSSQKERDMRKLFYGRKNQGLIGSGREDETL